jgi:hypothetical protein
MLILSILGKISVASAVGLWWGRGEGWLWEVGWGANTRLMRVEDYSLNIKGRRNFVIEYIHICHFIINIKTYLCVVRHVHTAPTSISCGCNSFITKRRLITVNLVALLFLIERSFVSF